jgi:hypothetical protein
MSLRAILDRAPTMTDLTTELRYGHPVRQVVLDSDAVNPLAQPDALRVIQQAIADGRLELLVTHIVREQVAATPDPIKRAALHEVLALARDVPTSLFVFGISAFGGAALGEPGAVFVALRGQGSVKDLKDALIATPASASGRTLCLIDRRATNRARRAGYEVMTPIELLTEMGYHLPPAGTP